jgi:hypothetical protein
VKLDYRKTAKNYLKQTNSVHSAAFVEVSKSDYPGYDSSHLNTWRNNRFLVQAFLEPTGYIRLSVNRTDVKGFGKNNSPVWKDGITWDELQEIKNQLGFEDKWAVECYPPPNHVQNVSNMRHLWILPEPPTFGWRNHSDRQP